MSSINALECEDSYSLASEHLNTFDTNSDNILDESEALESFAEVADLVMMATGVEDENLALAGYLWVLKKRTFPKSMVNKLKVFRLSNRIKEGKLPKVRARRFSIEAGIRIMLQCDEVL